GYSDECFKIYFDKKRSWDEANTKCQSEGMTMAKPDDPLTLRNYLNTRYGDSSGSWPYVWLPARGTGNYVHWQPNGERIQSDSTLWYGTEPAGYTSSSNCLMLYTSDSQIEAHPQSPYAMNTCTAGRYALCEQVNE
ncbi:unnamed protein product, partial [Meganyctiphanes norvegica]